MHRHDSYYNIPHGTTFRIEEDLSTSISIMLVNFACDWLRDDDKERMNRAGYDLRGIIDAVDHGRGEFSHEYWGRAWLNLVGAPGMQRETETAENVMTWLRGRLFDAAGPSGAAVGGALNSLLRQVQDNRNCIVAYRRIHISAPSNLPVNDDRGEENVYILDQPHLKSVQTVYDMGYSLKRI
jgi:hypothetical protein